MERSLNTSQEPRVKRLGMKVVRFMSEITEALGRYEAAPVFPGTTGEFADVPSRAVSPQVAMQGAEVVLSEQHPPKEEK